MKILVVGDIHVCKQSSIITGFGDRYTDRLENCVKSINWCERTAVEKNCDSIVYLGDFFDKPNLDEITLTAIKDIQWSDIQKYVIVGNHESSESDLRYSSTKSVEGPHIEIVSRPMTLAAGKANLVFIPYIVEALRKPLADYLPADGKKTVVFSHNDIKGIQMGPIMSQSGFDINEINGKHDFLMVNGHLHNGNRISKNLINLGILTGANFGEDAARYPHNIMVLDTDTLAFELIENPYAFNFYKLEVNSEKDLAVFDRLKDHAVLSVKCLEPMLEATRAKISSVSSKLAGVRIITVRPQNESQKANEDISDLVMDHMTKFCECCRNKIDNTDILEAELAEICK